MNQRKTVKDKNGIEITLGSRVKFTPEGENEETASLVESIHEEHGTVIVRASHNETLSVKATDCAVVTDHELATGQKPAVKPAKKGGRK